MNKLKVSTGLASLVLVASIFAGLGTMLTVIALLLLFCEVDNVKGVIVRVLSFYLGLVLFVGIPLPGTGAWTGCLVASVLEMDKKKSFVAALIGVFIASIIMMILSFGILSKIV